MKIGLSMFFKLRPRNVKPMGKAKSWLVVCANLELKLKTINSHLTIPHLYALSNITMCDTPDGNGKYHNSRCIRRTFPNCGVAKKLTSLNSLNKETSVTWSMWELVSQEIKKATSTTSTIVKKRMLVTKPGKMGDLINELEKELEPFPEHLFNKDWQNDQLQMLRKNLPPKSTLSILDRRVR